MTLTPQQQALLLVAMDPGANPNEQNLAAVAFFRQLREQFSDGYALLARLGGPQEEHSRSKYGSEILGFGKYKGQKLSEVPTPYLLWILDNVDWLDRYLRCAIERYLQDTQYAN